MPSNVIVKNVSVSPAEAPNHGAGRVSVSAVVFTAADGAGIQEAALDLSALADGLRVVMIYEQGSGIEASREGVYTGSFFVPLLADPGSYNLPVQAVDTLGNSGVGRAGLEIKYSRPAYSGGVLAADNQELLTRVSRAPLVPGNRVQLLLTGEEAFEKRMSLIRSAKRQINLQSYTLDADGLCGELVEALQEKAEAGVEVNVILNLASQLGTSPLTAVQLGLHRVGLGLQELRQEVEELLESKRGFWEIAREIGELFRSRDQEAPGVNLVLVSDEAILGPDRELADRGRRTRKWLHQMAQDEEKLEMDSRRRPLALMRTLVGGQGLPSLPLLAYAVHEKVMVADGERAIVGGRNLEDPYFTRWIDADVYIEGPIVAAVQEGFFRNLDQFLANLDRPDQFTRLVPALADAGPGPGRYVQSRPWLGEYQTLDFLVSVFQMARDRILVSSQFIVLPDCILRQALIEAASRGVKVRVLTNSFATSQELGFAAGYLLTLNYLEELLAAGIRVYELKGPDREEEPAAYLHAKLFLVDGELAALGSVNLSIRSCFIESENLLGLQDPDAVARLEDFFWDLVRNRAAEITPDSLKQQKEKHGARVAMARYLELFY